MLVRVTVGVEAHTHEYIATAHEDQKFGFSLAGGAARWRRCARVLAPTDHLRLVGLHCHIGSQIFDTAGLRGGRRTGWSACCATSSPSSAWHEASQIAELDLGGGFGIAYLPQDDPPPSRGARRRAGRDRRARVPRAAGLPVPRLAVEPGRAIAGPGTVTLYEVGTVKDVAVDAARHRTLRQRRRRDERQHPHRAVRRRLRRARWPRGPRDAPPTLARVVGKHCESGDIVVRDAWLPADVAAG